jgi:O-antigen/teichoic acid export membrane protein
LPTITGLNLSAAPATNRLSRNTLTLIVNNIASAGLSFLLSALIGRTLGEQGLGAYAAVLAWIFPLGMLAEFGLGTLITREVAQDVNSGAGYLRAILRIYAGLGSALVVALWLFAPFLSGDATVIDGLRISAPLLLIGPCFGAFTAIFRARGEMWPIPWLNIGMWLSQVGLTIVALYLKAELTTILVINVATSVGQLVAAWGIYRRWFKEHSRVGAGLRPAPTDTLELLKRAWPFALGAVLVALQGRAAIILLERLADTGQVGYYAAANRFLEAGRMLPNAFFGALFPTLAMFAANPMEKDRVFSRATLILSAFGAAFGLILSLLAGWIVPLVYGATFTPSTPALQILAWALLPALLRAARSLYWYASGREHYANIITALMLGLQILLAGWMIPRYGAVGAAASTLTVEIMGLALLWREIPLPNFRRLGYGKS